MNREHYIVHGRRFGEQEYLAFLAEFKAAPHPMLALPTMAQVAAALESEESAAVLMEQLKKRQQKIALAERDPLRFGFEPSPWLDMRALLAGTYPGMERVEDLLILGGNGSTKSWCGVKLGVEDLVNNANHDWAFFHSSHDSSINQQQQLVYKFLPPEWRDLGKVSEKINVTYSTQTGFSNNRFVLPNGSRGLFFNFSQEPRVIVGYKLNGATCDELITPEHLREIRFRLWDRKGKLLKTYTPVDGYTAAVREDLAGAEIVTWRESKFLPDTVNVPTIAGAPRGKMPYVLKGRRSNSAVMCFFSEDNPFNDPAQLAKQFETATTAEKKIRAYGWPEKMSGTQFPKFGGVHVIKRAEGLVMPPGMVPPHPWGQAAPGGQWSRTAPTRPGLYKMRSKRNFAGADMNVLVSERDGKLWGTIPGGELLLSDRYWSGVHWSPVKDEGPKFPAYYPKLAGPGTNYVYVDPGEAKNWFIKWYRVNYEGWTTVYREWPDRQTHGEWALPGNKHDGEPGPAQRSSFGRSIVDYKQLILQAEGWVWDPQRKCWDGTNAEPIEKRGMDPRFGGAEVPSMEEGTSIISLLEDEQLDGDGNVIGPSMVFEAAPGDAIKGGLQMLNDRFNYDMEKPVTVLNCPKWYVVDACEQSIYAYREYTGLDGLKGALKDVIDPDRYFVTDEPIFVSEETFEQRRGGAY